MALKIRDKVWQRREELVLHLYPEDAAEKKLQAILRDRDNREEYDALEGRRPVKAKEIGRVRPPGLSEEVSQAKIKRNAHRLYKLYYSLTFSTHVQCFLYTMSYFRQIRSRDKNSPCFNTLDRFF